MNDENEICQGFDDEFDSEEAWVLICKEIW